MSINVVIISRFGNQSFIDHVKSYDLQRPGGSVNVIYPTDSEYETNLIKPYLYTDKYTLIIYDWSTTLSADINNDIEKIQESTFDLVYLGKYLDTCSKYSLNREINKFSLVSGSNPIGFNAVIMTPVFTQKLLDQLNSKSYYSLSFALSDMEIDTSVVSFATSPNLFVYNPLYNSIDTSKSYNVKTEECIGVTSQLTPPSDNNLIIFWIILIILIVCLILWFLFSYTSFGYKTKYYDVKELKNNTLKI
jgi:hypothetical protein